ncbi:MAG: hypothetical protein ABI051_11140 [Vicinamibacterales bacterium]
MSLLLRPASMSLLASMIVTAGLAVMARAADPIVASTWAAAEVTADGNLVEWRALETIDKGLQVAAANDATSVYVAVLASSPQMRVSLSRGLVLWLDATGGHNETLGLQLPGPSPVDPSSPTQSATGGARLTAKVGDHVDVLGPGKLGRRLLELTPSSPVTVATGGEDGAIGFEARIPLARAEGNGVGIGTSAGGAFALGIATPIPRRGPREPMEPIYWPDPYAGTRILGLGGPEPPSRPLPDSSNRPEKEIKPKVIKLWVAVRLAAAR